MKIAKLGSSSNSNRHPYAKYAFTGGGDCKKIMDEISANRENKPTTLQLMDRQQWRSFCIKRQMP